MAASSGNPDEHTSQKSVKKTELEFAVHPFISPPYLKHQQQHQITSLLSPTLPTDSSTIFPVFPLAVDQAGPDQDGFSSFLFDGAQPDGIAEKSRPSGRQCRPSASKASRSKRKIEKQKTAVSSRMGYSWTSVGSSSASSSSYRGELINHPKHLNADKLKLVLHKELRRSDVSSLGRIILPKRDAEENLPYLAVKEGIQIMVRDLVSSQLWCMRYRYWPNNRSRMYVLEHTGEFVKQHDLGVGDLVTLYKDERNQLLFIYGTKMEQLSPSPLQRESVDGRDEDGDDVQMKVLDGKGHYKDVSSNIISTHMVLEITESSSSDNNAFSLEASTVNLGDCDLGHLERLSGFEDCDLSLYDDNDDDNNGGGGEEH